MPKNIQLTREQVIFLFFLGVIGNIVYIHTWIDDYTDRAAWVAGLLGILFVIPFAVWIFYLGKFSPQSTVFDILERGLGKLPNIAIILIFILINITIAVTHLNMFTQMIKVFFLMHTPPWVIMLFIILICVMFAYGEIKTFGRLVEVLAVFGIINYFAAFIFAPKLFHIEYVIPVFDISLTGFIKGTIFMLGGGAEVLLIFMVLVRYISDPGKHYMWIVTGISLSAVVFSVAIMFIIGMMSPELAKRIAFGGVNAARLIQIGEFLQGLEIFIFGTYQIIAIGKITITIYCAWTSAKKIFNKKPLLQLIIIALLILIPSIWLTSYSKAYFLAVFLASYIILPFSVFTLLLASISVIITNKRTGSTSK